MAERALVVAVLGAESTGKTALVQALVPRLAALTGRRVAGVGEWLRAWCDREGRTPRRDEQASIAAEQHRRIDAAAAAHDIVVADTTALQTAVYSRLVFGDDSLDATAAALHARADATLLTALDLPWVPDGHQRDGPHVREPVDTLLRAALARQGTAWSAVHGAGDERAAQTLAALRPLLQADSAPRGGLFTRLSAGSGTTRTWSCACCLDPPSERALFPRSRDLGNSKGFP